MNLTKNDTLFLLACVEPNVLLKNKKTSLIKKVIINAAKPQETFNQYYAKYLINKYHNLSSNKKMEDCFSQLAEKYFDINLMIEQSLNHYYFFNLFKEDLIKKNLSKINPATQSIILAKIINHKSKNISTPFKDYFLSYQTIKKWVNNFIPTNIAFDLLYDTKTHYYIEIGNLSMLDFFDKFVTRFPPSLANQAANQDLFEKFKRNVNELIPYSFKNRQTNTVHHQNIFLLLRSGDLPFINKKKIYQFLNQYTKENKDMAEIVKKIDIDLLEKKIEQSISIPIAKKLFQKI